MHRFTKIALSLSIAATFVASIANAQTPSASVRTERNISLALANEIAGATVAACSANGYAVTATVVDRAGSVRAVQRADNAGPHTLASSQQKAFTSASAKNTTPTAPITSLPTLIGTPPPNSKKPGM